MKKKDQKGNQNEKAVQILYRPNRFLLQTCNPIPPNARLPVLFTSIYKNTRLFPAFEIPWTDTTDSPPPAVDWR